MKMTREDERKLYEAYEVLDRILNGKSTLQYIINKKIDLIMDKIDKKIKEIEIRQTTIINMIKDILDLLTYHQEDKGE